MAGLPAQVPPGEAAHLVLHDGDCGYLLANYRTGHARLFKRSQAALFVAEQLGWPWKAAALLRVLPIAALDHVYDAVARNRYRIGGRVEQCLAPRPEFRGRFIE